MPGRNPRLQRPSRLRPNASVAGSLRAARRTFAMQRRGRRRRRPSRLRRSAPPSHVVIAPAGRLDDRHQRLHVVGVQRRLDHDVDQSHREQAIGVAIAAPARQPRAVGHAVERGALARRRGTSWDRCRRRPRRRRVGQRRVRERAPLAPAPPLGAAAGRREERFADVRLVRDADDDAARRRGARSASPSASGPRMKLRVPSMGSITHV